MAATMTTLETTISVLRIFQKLSIWEPTVLVVGGVDSEQVNVERNEGIKEERMTDQIHKTNASTYTKYYQDTSRNNRLSDFILLSYLSVI